MDKYINAQKLKDYISSLSTNAFNEWDTLGIMMAIDKQPTEDVTSVQHGHWIKKVGGVHFPWKCSLCGRVEAEKEPYCNCGAKMDEVEVE